MGFKYVAIDVETTGLNPVTDQVLSIAAVVDDLSDTNTPVERLPTFQAYVLWPKLKGDPFALWMNAELIKKIANKGREGYDKYYYLESSNVADRLSVFLDTNGFDLKRGVNAAGKNFSGFDKRFLESNFNIDSRIKFNHRVLDPGSMYFNPLIHNDKLPDLKECCRIAGFQPEALHEELGDCRDVVRLIRYKVRMDK